MYDIKHDIFTFSILSVPLFIITGGHAIIAMMFLGVLPYHIYCNSQEKKRREEAYQLSLQHAKELEESNRPYMIKSWKRWMRQGSPSCVPEREREYIKKLIEEEDAIRAANAKPKIHYGPSREELEAADLKWRMEAKRRKKSI